MSIYQGFAASPRQTNRRCGLKTQASIAVLLIFSLCLVPGCGRGKKRDQSNDPSTNPKSVKNDPSQPAKPPKPRLPDIEPTEVEGEVTDMDMDALVEALGHADLKKRYQAVDRLSEQPEESVPRLIEALEAENYHVRAGAAFALGSMGQNASSALEALAKARDHDSRPVVKDAAAFAIDAIEEAAAK